MTATLSDRGISVHRTGSSHGPITRLVSPSDLGQLIKPFVFLDLFDAPAGAPGKLGMHPHSGIATLTLMLEGGSVYEDSTGRSGVLPQGGVEWMQAGNGVWHDAGPANEGRSQGFQLWVALPPELENQPAFSMYLAPEQIPRVGAARLILGTYEGAVGPVPAPSPMNYLFVSLAAGQRWSYTPPEGHTVAWVAVSQGQLLASEATLNRGEVAVFETSNQALNLEADGPCEFVLGSAAPHPYELALGNYSVHTSLAALAIGEAGIRRARRLLDSAPV